MRTTKSLLFIALGLVLITGYTEEYPWVGETYISNNMRHCKYSNGKYYSFDITEMCPMNVKDSAPGMGQGPGFLKQEYEQGMAKVCVYEVMGEIRAVRQQSSFCPLNKIFN